MKVPYEKGVADHLGPESCVGSCEAAGEALTGENAGLAIEPRKNLLRGVDVVRQDGKPHRWPRSGKLPVDPAWSENQGMHRSTSHGNREIPWSPPAVMAVGGRVGKSGDASR